MLPDNYEVIETPVDLMALRFRIEKHGSFSFDTETQDLHPRKYPIYCVSIYTAGHSYLVNFDHPGIPQTPREAFKSDLSEVFANPKIKKVCFNESFDAGFLKHQLGVECSAAAFDASVGIWLVHSNAPSKGLKELSDRYLGIKGKTFKEIFGRDLKWIEADADVAKYYALKDAELHWKLGEYVWDKLKEDERSKKIYVHIEKPIAAMYREIEQEGFPVDVEYLQSTVGPELDRQIEDAALKMEELGVSRDLNLSSPKQMAELLFDTWGLPEIKGRSTDESVLEKLKNESEAVGYLLEHRGLVKLKGTYVDGLLDHVIDGIIYPSLRVIGSDTGRSSGARPNMLNLPSDEAALIRQAFLVPDEYVWVSKDYSGQELRWYAHYTRDGYLIEIVCDPSRDFYSEVAQICYPDVPAERLKKGSPERDTCKVVVLAWQYDAKGPKIAQVLKRDKNFGFKVVDQLDNRFPGKVEYTRKVINFAKTHGYVETILGRRKYIDFRDDMTWGQRTAAEREAINGPMQGSGADQLKLSAVLVNKFFKQNGLRSRVKLLVHDELLCWFHKEEWCDELSQEVDEIMVNAVKARVPFKVGTTVYPKRWGIVEEEEPVLVCGACGEEDHSYRECWAVDSDEGDR